MADQGGKAGDRKQTAEDAARTVLAKHPCVVAGVKAPDVSDHDARQQGPTLVGSQNVIRALKR